MIAKAEWIQVLVGTVDVVVPGQRRRLMAATAFSLGNDFVHDLDTPAEQACRDA